MRTVERCELVCEDQTCVVRYVCERVHLYVRTSVRSMRVTRDRDERDHEGITQQLGHTPGVERHNIIEPPWVEEGGRKGENKGEMEKRRGKK